MSSMSHDGTPETAIRIAELMRQRHLTAQAVSFDLRVSPSVVSRWLNGQTLPSARYIVELCEQYQISADWLLGLSDTPHPAPTRARTAEEVDASADVSAQTTPPHSRRSDPKRIGN